MVALGSLMFGITRNGYDVRVGLVGLIIGFSLLISYGALPNWGYVIVAMLLMGLMFGVGGSGE